MYKCQNSTVFIFNEYFGIIFETKSKKQCIFPYFFFYLDLD